MRPSKSASWVILSLVVLNTALLAVFLWAQRRPPAGPIPRHLMVERWQKELHLTPQQSEQFRDLYRRHFDTVDSLAHRMREEKRQSMEALFQPQPDTADVQRHQDSAIVLQGLMEKELTRHFFELRSVCTPDQQPLLLSILQGAMRPPGPPPGGGPR